MRSLQGKRVFVTGGARGIGLAIGRQFAREGAEVLLGDLDEAALPAAEEAIREAGGTGHGYVVDVTSEEAVATARQRMLDDGGPIEVLVNNAGVVFGGRFLDTPLQRHKITYGVNLVGLLTVTHAFLGDLIDRPEGHLVQIASASGFIGLPYGSTYASSKWGVIGLSESLRLELDLDGHDHVGVTTVCPSYVDTGLFEGAKPPRTTAMVKPDHLAELVVQAVKKNDAWVMTPWVVSITPATRALLPTWAFDKVAWALGVTSSMKQWKGHGGKGS